CEDVVVSSRVRLARNIKGLPFPDKLSGQEEIYSVLMRGVEQGLKPIADCNFYKMQEINPLYAQSLVESHLISKDLLGKQYAAVVISKKADISVMINEEDHIRAQCIMPALDMDTAFKKIVEADKAMSKHLDYAFDNKYGYLTACPTNMGAGMRVSFMALLQALVLTDSINSILAALQQIGITARGVYGEGSGAQGFMYQLSNQAMIGASEEEILSRMKGIAQRIIKNERVARGNLVKAAGLELKDKIMRSYGVLKYAEKLSSQEFMELLAYVKLGIILEYIDIELDKVNKLITKTQPAMLCKQFNKKLGAEERDIVRAKIVRTFLA
ncbi:MAG: protein arginine kinase, partial [Clostridia bacterium]|nr:protein arginine kinase [Clostridia bacterium]